MAATNKLAVFVKPWKSLSLAELGARMQEIGFEWIELPVRPGFPCQPDTIEHDLPEAARILGDFGVHILNVAVDLPLTDERLYAACAQASVDLNRVMFRRGERNYWEAEKDARQQLDAALPLCERYNVRTGVQNHAGNFVGSERLFAREIGKSLAEHPRFDRARSDGVNADVVRTAFVGRGFREEVHPRLARAVYGKTGERVRRRQRRDVHDLRHERQLRRRALC